MLVINEKRALGFRHILNFLSKNLAAVNEKLLPADVAGLLINLYGVVMTIVIRGGNKILVIEGLRDPEEGNIEIKLGRGKHVFNKRVLNDLEVYYHTHYRRYFTSAMNDVQEAVNTVSINKAITDLTFLDRVFGRAAEGTVRLGDQTLDTLVEIKYTAKVNVFGKITVQLYLDTRLNRSCIAGIWYPVHAGSVHRYESTKDMGTISKWIRGSILAHMEYLFK